MPTTKRTGYTFAGWYTAKSGGSKISASTKATKNVTYYAHWTANKYKVKFDGNGATSGSTKAQSRTYGDKKALTANGFKRTNYHFKGWATAKGGSVKFADKQVADITTKSGATVTLYAVWELSTYKVKFDGNGATGGSMKAQSINVGATKALTANAFKRTGYTFQGWAKKKGATKADYKNKAKVKNLSTKNGATVTLYAVWKANSYTVKFDANGGMGTMKAQTAGCGAATALSANGFKRAGYEFLGWATSKNATKATYSNKAKVKDLAKAGKSATLYAVWSLPVWAKGKFNGWGGYLSASQGAWFDGVAEATVSSLGKLSGTLTLEKSGGGTAKVAFSAKAFSKYYSSRSMDQVLDLLDPGEDDDPYGIVEDAENGFVPAKIAAYVYKGVSFKMPDGTARTADVVLLSRLYDGKNLCGFCCLSLASGMDMGLCQNLFDSKHVALPKFDGTPKKSFTVSSYLKKEVDYPSDLTKVEVTFGANGKLTVVGYKGAVKKWTTSATLRVGSHDGSVFGAATDFMTPNGAQLWFDCDLKPGSNGKISASGITIHW